MFLACNLLACRRRRCLLADSFAAFCFLLSTFYFSLVTGYFQIHCPSVIAIVRSSPFGRPACLPNLLLYTVYCTIQSNDALEYYFPVETRKKKTKTKALGALIASLSFFSCQLLSGFFFFFFLVFLEHYCKVLHRAVVVSVDFSIHAFQFSPFPSLSLAFCSPSPRLPICQFPAHYRTERAAAIRAHPPLLLLRPNRSQGTKFGKTFSFPSPPSSSRPLPPLLILYYNQN